MHLCGVARSRGERWAISVAARCGRSRPWPSSERAHSIARAKVADIAGDPVLHEELAREVEEYAARWWSMARDFGVRRRTTVSPARSIFAMEGPFMSRTRGSRDACQNSSAES